MTADFGKLLNRGTELGEQAAQENERMNKLSEYVKVAEAAEIMGVSQNTLRTWAEDGKIPMHRNPANGYRLFRRSDLDKFLRRIAKPVGSARPKKAK